MKQYKNFFTMLLILALFLSTGFNSFAETKIIRRGNPEIKEMALTFDDGNDPKKVKAIVDKLNKYDVDGTFFFVGTFIANHKDLINEMIEQGHEIVNHTFSHKKLTKIDDQSIQNEIENTKYHYYNVTNEKMLPLIRPPYGSYDQRVLDVIGKNKDNYLVMWSIDTEDWRGISSEKITKTTLDEAGNGKIVLMHTNKNVYTDLALDGIIQGLQSKGYKLVTVSDMISKLPLESQLPSIQLSPLPSNNSTITEIPVVEPVVSYTPPVKNTTINEEENFFVKVIRIFIDIFN